jgi:hypothetical protein
MAQIERIFCARVTMDTGEKHIRTVVKNSLRTVAVVNVPVDDGDAGNPVLPLRVAP